MATLPCVWHYEEAHDLTFRWGRKDGYIAVLNGDRTYEHHDHGLVARIPVAAAWVSGEDIRNKARRWTRANR
ncbi:hypothetical protein [Saccharopolyspora gloriosae]|uniref:hypothetical protein n=1 Tax=Saccharopolyspora gloriosae TaxID=455344 RepID=UPI001FB7D5B1|nr:hypothetical protein [Saccharopolyspora gloriosae]